MTAEQQLMERNDAWVRAIRERDAAAAEEVLADDYALVLVLPERRVVPRAEWLDMLPEYVVDGWRVVERVVDVRPELAVILQRIEMTATVYGVDRSGTFIISDTWIREGDTWRVWRRHSSPVAGTALPSS